MQIYDTMGRLVKYNPSPYLMDWDCKERSKFQYNVKRFLYPFWKHHVCYRELLMPGSRQTIDILNLTLRIAVEPGGDFHNKYTPHFHKTRMGYLDQMKRDHIKAQWCEKNNIKLVEIFSKDLPLTKEFFLNGYGIKL